MPNYWTTTTKNNISSAVEFLNINFANEHSLFWSEELIQWKLASYDFYTNGLLLTASYNGKIVGVVTLTIKLVNVNCKPCRIGEIGDAYIDTSFTRYAIKNNLKHKESYNYAPNNPKDINSVFSMLILELIEWGKKNSLAALYGTPNNIAYPSYIKRLGFEDPKVYNKSCYTFVLLTKYLLATRYKSNRFINFSAKIFFYIYTKFIGLISNFILLKFNVEEIDPNGIKYSEFQAAAQMANNKTHFIRDQAWIKWRFLTNPTHRYRLFSFSHNGSVLGWVVVRIKNNNLIVCDWSYHISSVRFTAFLAKVLMFLNYQGYIVKFWYKSGSNLQKYLRALLLIKASRVNLIYMKLDDSLDSQELVNIFDEFTIALSDNV